MNFKNSNFFVDNVIYLWLIFSVAVNSYGVVHDATGKAEAPIWTPGKSIHTFVKHVREYFYDVRGLCCKDTF